MFHLRYRTLFAALIAIVAVSAFAAPRVVAADHYDGLRHLLGADPSTAFLPSDPLRAFLPSPKYFEPTPGGQIAISNTSEKDSVEKRRNNRSGGIVAGYCLNMICNHVTHLVVYQICQGQIGGLGNQEALILGILKFPAGNSPGVLISLQGQDYMKNFAKYGPFRQTFRLKEDQAEGHYDVRVLQKGEVAPLEMLGLQLKVPQRPATRAFQFTEFGLANTGVTIPSFEIRNYCKKQLG